MDNHSQPCVVDRFERSPKIPFVGAFYHSWSGVYNNSLDRVFAALIRGGA